MRNELQTAVFWQIVLLKQAHMWQKRVIYQNYNLSINRVLIWEALKACYFFLINDLHKYKRVLWSIISISPLIISSEAQVWNCRPEWLKHVTTVYFPNSLVWILGAKSLVKRFPNKKLNYSNKHTILFN